ncbi:DEAD/DEAH box helicase [Mesobacillus boroniphilus]|uniref:DNA/RNA helicases n=1 Tax=Mesobacillus boroniphilus JCM 21738 TaxID=1294265 RepID=W4RU04_9BACI|nr:C-terminal helicase domain-containing protein [Mesobacillus boroniphilus]GAE47348.1 DNA/RNA helicases [Mesobacillus boroniphilus JCM 21738]
MSKHYQDMIAEGIKSPKLAELVDICTDRLESGVNKIVIFTQFARMQSIIEKELSKHGKVALLNGSMSSAKRQEMIDTFQNDPEYKFFILTDAGNYGINLQFANTLINYDSPWNPAVFEQRAGRVHRIGSTHSVVDIISLVTMGTIDEKIQETLEEKRKLGEAVIERNATERSAMNNLISSIKKISINLLDKGPTYWLGSFVVSIIGKEVVAFSPIINLLKIKGVRPFENFPNLATLKFFRFKDYATV